MNYGTKKLHGLGHFMTEFIKYLATSICSRNKQHILCLRMAIFAMFEKKLLNVQKNRKNTKNNDTLKQQNIATILGRILFAGVQGKTMIKNLARPLKRHFDKPFKSRNIYRTKQLLLFNYYCLLLFFITYYCNKKDMPEYLKSHLMYEFCCSACNNKYIGKKD